MASSSSSASSSTAPLDDLQWPPLGPPASARRTTSSAAPRPTASTPPHAAWAAPRPTARPRFTAAASHRYPTAWAASSPTGFESAPDSTLTSSSAMAGPSCSGLSCSSTRSETVFVPLSSDDAHWPALQSATAPRPRATASDAPRSTDSQRYATAASSSSSSTTTGLEGIESTPDPTLLSSSVGHAAHARFSWTAPRMTSSSSSSSTFASSTCRTTTTGLEGSSPAFGTSADLASALVPPTASTDDFAESGLSSCSSTSSVIALCIDDLHTAAPRSTASSSQQYSFSSSMTLMGLEGSSSSAFGTSTGLTLALVPATASSGEFAESSSAGASRGRRGVSSGWTPTRYLQAINAEAGAGYPLPSQEELQWALTTALNPTPPPPPVGADMVVAQRPPLYPPLLGNIFQHAPQGFHAYAPSFAMIQYVHWVPFVLQNGVPLLLYGGFHAPGLPADAFQHAYGAANMAGQYQAQPWRQTGGGRCWDCQLTPPTMQVYACLCRPCLARLFRSFPYFHTWIP